MIFQKLKRKSLIQWCVASGVTFAALLVFLFSQGSGYWIQNAFFMTGLVFFMITLFQISRWTGIFDLITYGYNRIASSFKQEHYEDKRDSFFDYSRNVRHTVQPEPALICSVYWVISLFMRFFSV